MHDDTFHSEQMLQPPQQRPSQSAQPLLCVSLHVSWSRVRGCGGVSSPEARPRSLPQGRACLPSICRLSPAVSQSDTSVTGWAGGFKSWWRGLVKGNRCLLKPQGTSLKSSSTLPKVLFCNWWCPDSPPPVTHITTVCHVTSLLGGVEIIGLIFTSGLCEDWVHLVLFRIRHRPEVPKGVITTPKPPASLAHVDEKTFLCCFYCTFMKHLISLDTTASHM